MDKNSTDVDAWTVSLTGKVVTSLIFGSIILIGIIGNVVVLILIILVKKLHSVVNLCLGSLALADLIVLVFLPIIPWNILHGIDDSSLGRNFCIFINTIDRGATVCTVLIFLLIGVERYTVLCYPLKSIGVWTYQKVSLLLVGIWVITAGVSAPYGYLSRYEESIEDNKTFIYCYTDPEVPWIAGYETGLICVTYFLPVPILMALYGKMICALKQQITQGAAQGPAAKSAKKSRAQITRMLVLLVAVFIICLLPFRIFLLLYWYALDVLSSMEEQSYFITIWVCRIVLYVNHASNPIVYLLMSDNFRDGFKVVFCRPRYKSENAGGISRVSNTQLSSI